MIIIVSIAIQKKIFITLVIAVAFSGKPSGCCKPLMWQLFKSHLEPRTAVSWELDSAGPTEKWEPSRRIRLLQMNSLGFSSHSEQLGWALLVEQRARPELPAAGRWYPTSTQRLEKQLCENCIYSPPLNKRKESVVWISWFLWKYAQVWVYFDFSPWRLSSDSTRSHRSQSVIFTFHQALS